MARPLPVSIPVSSDIETLRKHIVQQLTNLSVRLAQQDKRTAAMSMGGNRLTDVPDPTNATDAVNLRTLKKELQGVSRSHQKVQPGQYYTIVWANSGTASGTAPPYVINPFRTGAPVIAKVYALGTGTGATGFNIYYAQGGTATPVKILTSDLILPANSKGPVSQTAFTITADLSVNDVLYTVVTTTGGANNLSVELLINS
jgi:hypothetical protein